MEKARLFLFCVILALTASPAFAGDEFPAPDPAGKWEKFNLAFQVFPPFMTIVPARFEVRAALPLPPPLGSVAVEVPEEGSPKIDMNRDGKCETPVNEGDPIIFPCKYADGESGRFAVRFFREIEGESWYFEPAGSMCGNVHGEKFALYDMNGNGKYDDSGMDMILCGKSQLTIPLGPVLSLKGKFYHLQVDPRGKSVSLQEFSSESGTIDFSRNFRAPGKLCMALVSRGNAWFDAGVRGGVKVPAGTYKAFMAVLRGKQISCDVGFRNHALEVKPGAVVAHEWGIPVKIDFDPPSCTALSSPDQKRLTFGKGKMSFVGKAGEIYTNFLTMGKWTFDKMECNPEYKILTADGAVACSGKLERG